MKSWGVGKSRGVDVHRLCAVRCHRQRQGPRASLRAAIPDLQFSLEDEFGEGNKVATRWMMGGSQGTLNVSGMDIFLIENGKIREIRVNMDTLAQAQQMGLIPPK